MSAVETWVFENIEVLKTGKVATKKLASGKVDTMYEVTPVDEFNGKWKKWAREENLYKVDDISGTSVEQS